ncbi:MAG: UDP-2,3-diacylglucosamine diphosphatase [Muribaculaceae bacterium]|nr:UDP-2,3-diacylglucosamine diphosphatase [Muribaculaceae bacterium]
MESGHDERRSQTRTRFPVKKAYFLSDTHLGAAYFPDSKERERCVVDFLESIRDKASEIYLLGDILDYWYEYRYVVPRGFVRFFGKIAELSDAGIKITWIIGNHDIWIFDYIPSELGVKVVDGSYITQVMGTRMLMAHGDGVWQHSRKFKILRSLFRNKFCQRLFAGIHPRWTVAFANAWSRHSRLSSDNVDNHKKLEIQRKIDYNLSRLAEYCELHHKTDPECRYYLFGHLHIIADVKIANDADMIILGDWLKNFSYAVYDGQEMKIEKYSACQIHT